jgi:hypothetical protein
MTWSRLLLGSLSPSKFGDEISSLADPGCLSQIMDPGSEFFPFRIPDPGSKFFSSWIPDPESEFSPSRILDPGSASKNSSILTKKWFLSSQKYDPSFPFRFRILDRILTFYLSWILILDPRSRNQGSKRQRSPDPGSRIRIRNTGDFGFPHAVGGSIGYWLSTGATVLTTHSMK